MSVSLVKSPNKTNFTDDLHPELWGKIEKRLPGKMLTKLHHLL